MRSRSIAFVAFALLGLATVANASTTIDREFGYASRVTATAKGGYLSVELPGAGRETRPGRPDLPWVSERVDLPPGMRVASVEVTSLSFRPLHGHGLVAPALVPTPGLGPEERSKPDPEWFDSNEPQPREVVSLALQGDQRGRNLAILRVNPAQWDPHSGQVRAIERLGVRLVLEPDPVPALRRERIVPEWEGRDGLPSGAPTRELGAVLSAASPRVRGKAAPFRPTQLPSVLGSPVAYVIVTSDAMAPVFQQLADWKTRCGQPAVVRTVSFIHDQYPSAADDGERIRLFLRDAYTRWGTKWALLGGDTDVIPVRQAYTTFYGSEMIATDLYYQCLDGNWNADGDSLWGEGTVGLKVGDSADLLPEIYVGRAPVTNPVDAQTFVNKTLQYERTPLGNYENRWLFFAEVLFPQPWTSGTPTTQDGGDIAEALLQLTDLDPSIQVSRMYENWNQPKWRPGVAPETRLAVIDSLNQGFGVALHIGHGYRNVMEVGDEALTNPDAMALHNGNKLMNLYAINCTSNAIDFPCIGESFILDPNGGAVTNIGSTRFDFPSSGQLYQYEYFRLFFQDSVDAVGELNTLQKLPFLGTTSFDGVDRWTQMTLLMLGDPELRLYRGVPRALSVTHPASIAIADTQFTVHVECEGVPEPGARVTAWRPDGDFATVLTDGSGDATLSFRPDSLGVLSLTVTAFDAHPVEADVAIEPSSDPVLVNSPATVVDTGAGGTVGDADGALDAGETVDLQVPLENQGGSLASNVTATLASTSPAVTFVTPSASYGDVPAGGTATAAVPFRIQLPYTAADQDELPFTLVVTDDGGHSWSRKLSLVVHAPELRSYSHSELELVGNFNGRPEPGETVNYSLNVRNGGTGTAHGVSLVLRNFDGLATVSDSLSTIGDLAPGASATGDPVTFSVIGAAARLEVTYSTTDGPLGTQVLNLSYPGTPDNVLALGQATSVALSWAHDTTSDLFGYNVYRSANPGGPYARVNAVPTGRTSSYVDTGLSPLTRYYYRVSSVDSSGNESGASAVANTSTNPPLHGIFPVPTGRTTPASIALERIWATDRMDILTGSDLLYVLHPDGTAPVDADGSSATLGDFTRRGSYYAGGPSAGVLDPAQGWSIVAGSWDSTAVYAFDKNGVVRPGFPVPANQPVWSSVAIGDLDGDGRAELCWGSNGNNFYAVHADGSELLDGDGNPSTRGVFKVLGSFYNYGTPALADLDGDGRPEIVYGGFDGNLYAWKPNGTSLPGFPYHTSQSITCSVAIGYLDGPGDTTPEIVFLNGADSLFVVEPNGAARPGFPLWTRAAGTTKTPSPAIADMDNDGIADIVYTSTNGLLYAFHGNGTLVTNLAGVRYSTLTSGASESSPVVADINGDGFNDVIIGDENGQLTAISSADGKVLPGFPIQLAGEVRGTPAVGDIDGDGLTEIVVADWDKNIYVWDYDYPFQPVGQAPWPQFHHDARRTGFSGAPLFVGGVDDGPGTGGVPAVVEFAAPTPNPARGSTRLDFAVPSSSAGDRWEMAIFDLNGRRIRTVDAGVARAGRYSLDWDLRDAQQRSVEGGVYFARFTLGSRSLSRKLVVLP